MSQPQTFSPALAEIRFGYGLSPRVAAPTSVEDMLARLSGPDVNAQAFPIPGMGAAGAMSQARRKELRARKALEGQAGYAKARDQVKAQLRQMRATRRLWAGQVLLRGIAGQDGFRERIVAFWGDHFTALGKNLALRHWTTPYVQRGLRPLVTGRFTDLLFAAVTHPLMVHYLDQAASFGPNSPAAKPHGRGLNENLAREVLELHSLGVDGPYSQADVRQLAELLTGLDFKVDGTLRFRVGRAEPALKPFWAKPMGRNRGLRPFARLWRILRVIPQPRAILPENWLCISCLIARPRIWFQRSRPLIWTMIRRFCRFTKLCCATRTLGPQSCRM